MVKVSSHKYMYAKITSKLGLLFFLIKYTTQSLIGITFLMQYKVLTNDLIESNIEHNDRKYIIQILFYF